jgi:nicotinamidase-related amidase
MEEVMVPSFYKPEQVKQLYIERAAVVADAAKRHREQAKIAPSSQDKFRIAAFGIDCQVGFVNPEASLFVPGAVEDTERTIAWVYNNLEKITGLFFSLDTHHMFQIFHPAWWIDRDGNHPPPFTAITSADVTSGTWTAVSHPREALEYTKKLEATGRYVLTIWPYHTLLGGLSHALVPALMEASMFHAIARSHQTHFETKGTHSLTENYSVLSPEVRDLGGKTVGTFNTPFFKMLMEYDRVYVFGQAKSHCVLSTLRDLQREVEAIDASLLQKIWILEDAMSPVPAPPLDPLPATLNFPALADEALRDFARAGMRVVKTTDDI